MSADYEDRMQQWSVARNGPRQNFERDLTWMNALEKFLDAHNRPAGEVDSVSYCVDSILATAAYSCPAKVSQHLENWGWLKRYSIKGHRYR
jgi:hypothetical protein